MFLVAGTDSPKFMGFFKMFKDDFEEFQDTQAVFVTMSPTIFGAFHGCWMGPPEARDHVSIDFGHQRFSLLWQQLGMGFFGPRNFDEIRERVQDSTMVTVCFFSEKTCGGRKRGGANLEILVLPVDVPAKRQSCIQSHGDFKVTKCSSFLRCWHFWGNCQKYNTQAERLACRATATTYCNAKFLDFLKLAHVFSLRKFWGVRRATGFQHVFLLWA